MQARAAQIRDDLGNPQTIMLGVDRLDYTKGIGHRLKAFGELLEEGRLAVEDITLVQVASPSRERVEAYQQLRDEIELTVGRINGDYGTISHQAVSYLHHGFPREEMAALYLAADVMLVTALRDGMNLVAKEYVAARYDEDGVLVLSEFTGASDELKAALLINPHDIDGVKDAIVRAVAMPRPERRKRMRSLRRRVRENDVQHWSETFLSALRAASSGASLENPLGDLEWTVDRPMRTPEPSAMADRLPGVRACSRRCANWPASAGCWSRSTSTARSPPRSTRPSRRGRCPSRGMRCCGCCGCPTPAWRWSAGARCAASSRSPTFPTRPCWSARTASRSGSTIPATGSASIPRSSSRSTSCTRCSARSPTRSTRSGWR